MDSFPLGFDLDLFPALSSLVLVESAFNSRPVPLVGVAVLYKRCRIPLRVTYHVHSSEKRGVSPPTYP